MGIALVWSSDLSTLASMTVLLLLIVFTLVNVSVLVLRRDRVDRPHFHAPTAIPVIGAVASVALMTTRDLDVVWKAGVLLAIGVVLWFVNKALTGPRGPFVTEELQMLEDPDPITGDNTPDAGAAARPSS